MAESTANCLFLISVDRIRIETGILRAQDFSGIEIRGWVTQGFLSSLQNNDLTMRSSAGSGRTEPSASRIRLHEKIASPFGLASGLGAFDYARAKALS